MDNFQLIENSNNEFLKINRNGTYIIKDKEVFDNYNADNGIAIINLVRKYAKLEAENKLLKESHHEIYEIYAGSESMIPETAAERYWIDRCKEMADIAGKLKGK